MAIVKLNILFFTAIAIIIWLIVLTSNQKMAKYDNRKSMESPDHPEFYFSFLQKLYQQQQQPSSSSENELIKNIDLANNKPSARQIIEYLNWANRSSCKLVHDFGGRIFKNPSGLDGQKAVCLDPKVVPQPDKSCLIYSIGINNEWSFDDIMEQYGCKIFAFDPSMDIPDHNRSPMIKFYNMGVSDVDKEETRNNKKWKLKTIQTIYKELGHEGKIIDYLKMDVENEEWKILPQMLKSGMMAKIRQLAVEIHLMKFTKLEEMHEAVGVIRSIEKSGFVRFDSKFNPWCIYNSTIPGLENYNESLCFEIAWYQILPQK